MGETGSGNHLSGSATNVVQAAQVHGGIHFHETTRSLPAPRQLPPDIGHFTNRTEYLGRLDDWLESREGDPGAVQIVAGTGGVGKTSLVTHWAHRVRDRFGDGDLFVDLHGYHPKGAVGADEALGVVLQALSVPDERIPDGVDARAALYRSLLHNRRMLILLDDASAPDQVRPLLPGGSSCKVLVTSRSRLVGLVVQNGAHCMSLDVLSPDRASELLRQVVGRRAVDEPEAVDRLAAYCGHLPLALNIAASQLLVSPGTRVSDLVDELSEERDRLDVLVTPGDESTAVRPVFSLSYRSLAPQVARAYRLLGLFPGRDIGAAAAAALLGLEPGPARRVLAELTSAHLLTEKDDRRYQMHDLLRLHAGECAEADEPVDERRAAIRRTLIWYAQATKAAVRAVIPYFSQIPVTLPETGAAVPEFPDRASALAWGDVERPNLKAAVQQASDSGEHELAWQLAVLMFGLLLVRKPYSDWVTTHEIGLESARLRGETAAEAWLLTSLSIAEIGLHRPERALERLEAALPQWRRDGTRWGIAWALRDTGAAYHQLGRHAEAIDLFRQALAMHLEDGDSWGEATAMAGLARAHVATGELDAALTEAQRALEIRRSHNDERNIGKALNDLGAVRLATGDFEQAGRDAAQALEILTAVDYWPGKAVSYELLGDSLDELGQPAEAAARWQAAIDLYELLGDPRAATLRGRLSV
ncbi:tetratricopeptide repeat protein [Saccharothrix sp. 6-C]|uniref:ATP-binding protein n=1 Tax=Saccharothrix sp. 6-C TaxID=2781735 RepID=UPI0019172302|nr:tetratricopeptide repeat protein [Saccharothrix sp. 6-C]QQQ74093.1 tetratricopeptide repeat protein [Saccharothrix sp. 6-C]